MTARPPRAPRPPMLTVAQAADQLGVSRMQAYRYIASGDLPASRYPSRGGKQHGPVRVDPADVERFIEAHRQPAAT